MRRFDCLVAFLLALAATSAPAKTKTAAHAALSRTGEINLGLAQSYLESNNLVDALDRAKRAVAADPNYGETHAVLGMIYLRIGDQANAATELESALKLAPASGPILNAHAAWLCELGKFDQADLEFRQALADPFYANPVQAYFNAGNCSLKAGRMAAAESYLRRALYRVPQDPQVLLTLAEVKFAQGQWLEARAFVQRCLAAGRSSVALDLAAQIEDAAGDKAAAARYRQQRAEQISDPAPTGEGAHQP